ncbi:ComEC/Rec2 family competence protein [Granulicella sp. L60]|uniref:ComEC/Rec2 family competence protein n=1 Tax=Granulicella sp. L60 TaxID=1641866 RepID=UPI00131B3721|nr:MBL fold metallo-hydrolase [Granulicella sp. L60]
MTTDRRIFLKNSAMASSAALFPKSVFASKTASGGSGFTLWQLPFIETNHGNSYVFRTQHGKVVVVDGGLPREAGYLRGFLGALGNEVEAWFLSHPHNDHVGALNEILKKPEGIVIKTIYYSRFSPSYVNNNPVVVELYKNLETYRSPSPAKPRRDPMPEDMDSNSNSLPLKVVDVQLGSTGEIDGLDFKILEVKNEEITPVDFNNSCMIFKVWDKSRSVVFLGDAGEQEGEKVLNGPFRRDLDCDFLQMAHHGELGVSKKFYQSIKFEACLWPAPNWNDLKETREWIKDKGIQKHFLAGDGLQIIQ